MNDKTNWNTIWSAINSVAIFLLFMYVFVNNDVHNIAIEKAEEVEMKLDAIQSMKADTIIVNINNNVTTPQPKVVIKNN